MPTFEITDPDGSVYHVEAPEGKTEADALAYVKSNHDKLKALKPEPSDFTKFGKKQLSDENPRWDFLGDTARAAKSAVSALGSDVSKAFPSIADRVKQTEADRAKYGLIGGAAADMVDKTARMGNLARIPLDALAVPLSPVTGALHSTAGSALSYLPGMDKQHADEAIDQSMMGIGPKGMAGGVPAIEASANSLRDLQSIRRDAKLPNQAVDKINARAKADNLTAQDVMDAQKAANETGDKITLMDIGKKNLQGLAGSIYRAPGAAGAGMKEFLDARVASAKDGLQRGIKGIAEGSSYDTINQLYDARSKAAQPLYKEALDVGPISSDRLNQFLVDPDVQAGMRRALKNEKREAIAEGRPFNDADYAITGWNEAGDPIMGPVPTMKSLAVAKEGLDARIAEMKDPTTGRPTKDGVALMKFRNAYLGELDKLNPKYAAARQAWSGPTQSAEAVEDGRLHFSRKETDPQVKAEFDALSPGDKEFYRLGAAEAKLDQIKSAVDAGDKSKKVINSDKDRDRFRMLFDSDADAQKFIDSVERKRTAFDTRQKITGGSPTAERGAEDNSEAVEALMGAANTLKHAAGQNWLGMAHSLYRTKRDIGLIPNPGLNDEMARLLTDPSLSVNSSPGMDLLAKTPLPNVQNYLARGMLNAARAGPYTSVPQFAPQKPQQ